MRDRPDNAHDACSGAPRVNSRRRGARDCADDGLDVGALNELDESCADGLIEGQLYSGGGQEDKRVRESENGNERGGWHGCTVGEEESRAGRETRSKYLTAAFLNRAAQCGDERLMSAYCKGITRVGVSV